MMRFDSSTNISETDSNSHILRKADSDVNVSNESKHQYSNAPVNYDLGGIPIFDSPYNIQPKLKINSPNDRFEKEADSMADQVMRMSDPSIQRKSSTCGGQMKEEEIQRAPLATQISHLNHHAPIQKKCAKCEEEEQQGTLQTKSNGASPQTASSAFSSQIKSNKGGGKSMDQSTRGFMESRFGMDFSGVRIHNNSQAAGMNQQIRARAFTVGKDVYFNQGEYAPESSRGKHLLAHELTHVVQQGASQMQIQPSSISPMVEESVQRLPFENDNHFHESFGNDTFENESFQERGSTLPYRQATELAECTRIMGEGSYEDCYQTVLGRHPNPAAAQARAQAAQRARYLASSCTHDAAALDWTDFQGNPPRGSNFSAWTQPRFDNHTVGTQQIIRASFLTNRSWVKTQFSNPTDRSLNDCGRKVTECEDQFDTITSLGRTGGDYSLGLPTGCPAAIAPDSSNIATNRAECSSLIGPECDRTAEFESLRLLRHEQYHFKIACELAKKGTLAILSGQNADRILRTVIRNANSQIRSYDGDTNHGCNPGPQSAWEQDIDNGLPAVQIGNP